MTTEEQYRCGNCGAHFSRRQALVTVLDAETPAVHANPPDLFRFDGDRAEVQLREESGDMAPIDELSNADDLHALLGDAEASGAIVSEREYAQILVYPLALSESDPVVAVCLGVGPTLLGHSQKLRRDDGEDDVTFTLRVLSDIVDEANALAAGRAADSQRLDRIAGFINAPGEVQGADFLEFVEGELRGTGRVIDVDE
jgi:hypothetical protein